MPLRHLLNSQKPRILQHEIHRYKSTSSHHLSTIEFLLVPCYHAKGILCFFHADGIPENPCLVYTLMCFSACRNINAMGICLPICFNDLENISHLSIPKCQIKETATPNSSSDTHWVQRITKLI
jgi:hypothetical protein